ncbi:hypothetical protein DV735_g2796, partial [Chaetothyriales sp. CBS 134920]
MDAKASRRNRIWTRRQIESQIADGRKIIVFEGQVLKVDAWIPYHPGGDKSILHMVGRDGTDEILALHSDGARQLMQKYVVGRVEGRWSNLVPPIQGGKFRLQEDERHRQGELAVEDSSSSASTEPSPLFEPVEGPQHHLRHRYHADSSSVSSISDLGPESDPTSPFDKRTSDEIAADLAKYPSLAPSSQDHIIAKYRELNSRLYAAGLYNCSYSAYAVECIRYTLLFIAFLVLLKYQYTALAGLALGLFWHQLAFTLHDAGHMGITHSFQIDSCIGIIVADFIGGLSVGWWKRNHNVHHIVTNSPEHDPDIEHLPFFAISHRFFSSLSSTYYDRKMEFDALARFSVKYQSYLYYPLLLFGRFNLYVNSWTYLLSPSQAPRKGPAWWHRYLELVGQVFFWTWYGYFTVYRAVPTASSRILFILISHMVTAPLHVQITLSHFAMSTADLGVHESFAQRTLRTTMDVDCPPWLDFIHGGLQFQAIHHLFPRLPRHNLRGAQKYVAEFCADVGIPYVRYGFVDGNKEVISRLGEVGKQVRIFEECRRVAAGNFVNGHGH